MRLVICDDDPHIVAAMQRRLEGRYPSVEVVPCCSGSELLRLAANDDIILLDVQMPDPDGMETAKRLRAADCRAAVIFLTGREDKVYDAFEVEAFRYLIKPVAESKLYSVIDAAIERMRGEATGEEDDAYLMIHSGGRHIQVKRDNIIYGEVFNRRVTLHCIDGDHEYYGRIKDLETELGEGFFRTHRSFVVNLAYVEGYDSHSVTLRGGAVAILSKMNYQDFVKAYMSYIKGAGNGL